MNKKIRNTERGLVIPILVVLLFGVSAKNLFAQTNPATAFVPSIGITSVPQPFAVTGTAGNVTYHYAVKGFSAEVPLTNVQVVDNACAPVTFVGGDDNGDGRLDVSETWRYTCTTTHSATTQSIAVVSGNAGALTATDTSHTTVVVGSNTFAPLVSIVNVSKVPNPLPLQDGVGVVTYTYRVNNPGAVPLNNVAVSDTACGIISGKLGDTNNNGLLDTNEVWIYSCTVSLTQTTANTATVVATANGLQATDNAFLTVPVAAATSSPQNLFDVGITVSGSVGSDFKIIVWEISSGILVALIVTFVLTRRGRSGRLKKKLDSGAENNKR